MVADKPVPLLWTRHRRARRYILRVTAEGAARVTIPPGGNKREGLRFVRSHVDWLEKQLKRRSDAPFQGGSLGAGSQIYYRGTPATVALKPEASGMRVSFGDCSFRVPLAGGPENLRPWIEQHLWAKAADELEARTLELAAENQLKIGKVAVRNQRSRWGSCSSNGTISLNWRLIQTLPRVSDYIIIHELMHLHEMNHSPRFWRRVAKVCPDFREAEHWLRRHASLLH